MTKTALIVGASGAIGSHLLSLLLASNDFNKVIYLGRSRLTHNNFSEDKKLQQHILPISEWSGFALDEPVDIAFCCLGTTIKQAGSQAAFKAVDLQAVIDCAKLAKTAGCEHFSVVSSAGAGGKLPGFYLQVKTEMEHQLQQVGFNQLQIFRPSLLDRSKPAGLAVDKRTGETIGLLVLQLLWPIVPKSQRPVAVETVAKAMLDFSTQTKEGCQIISRKQMG